MTSSDTEQQAPNGPLGSDGLHEKYAGVLRDFAVLMIQRGGRDLDELAARDAGAILAIRDRRMEQLAAGRETWKGKATEMEADRDRLLRCIAKVRGELDQYAAGKWTGTAVERFQELRRDIEAWLPEADDLITPAVSS